MWVQRITAVVTVVVALIVSLNVFLLYETVRKIAEMMLWRVRWSFRDRESWTERPRNPVALQPADELLLAGGELDVLEVASRLSR